MRRRHLAAALLVATAACGKDKASSAPAEAGAAAAASAGVLPAAAQSASASAQSGAPVTWNAKYTIAAASVYVPSDKDWKNVKLKTDESQYLGEGTLALTTDPTGRVAGASEGPPLGTAVLDGWLEGGKLTATVRRKDPTDNGLTGTLVATMTGDKLEGTLKLAEANAAVVREGKLTATKQ
jgi:hypothetical protein